VKRAVEELFKVKVDEVRLANVRGKVKRMGRWAGKRRDWRKAYVRLKEGEKAPDFIEGRVNRRAHSQWARPTESRPYVKELTMATKTYKPTSPESGFNSIRL